MMSGYRIFPAGHPHGMGHVRPHYHGFCSACCHPISKCCCGHRECRKVAKELLADPLVKKAKELKDLSPLKKMMTAFRKEAPPERTASLFDLLAGLMETEQDVEGTPSQPPTEEGAAAADREKVTAEMIMKERQESRMLRLGLTEVPSRISTASAVIGGGRCVHLSIEYMPAQSTQSLSKGGVPALVAVAVIDSQGTILLWGKMGVEGYTVKEDIVTTNPGARLTIVTLNAVARVRWCEVFSC